MVKRLQGNKGVFVEAKFKIKREIIRIAQENYPEEFTFGPLDTEEQIDEEYSLFNDTEAGSDYCREIEQDYRYGEVETGLPVEWSRHYESKAVATQTAEGDWIGWTFWHGGGKHGEPESIDWVEDSYNLKCTEEEKIITVRNFEILKENALLIHL